MPPKAAAAAAAAESAPTAARRRRRDAGLALPVGTLQKHFKRRLDRMPRRSATYSVAGLEFMAVNLLEAAIAQAHARVARSASRASSKPSKHGPKPTVVGAQDLLSALSASPCHARMAGETFRPDIVARGERLAPVAAEEDEVEEEQ